MTEEQINAAIAKHLGWTGVVSYPDIGVMGLPPARNECDIRYLKTAMWTQDLNAMHEAESTLNDTNMFVMAHHIERLVSVHGQHYFHATARQRAEAFLRTLGKWEEVQG